MLKRVTLTASLTVLSASALLAAAFAAPQAGAALDRADRTFVMHAAQGGMMEVRLGEIASDHAANDAVKAFGRRMVEDHGKASRELMTLAGNKGVTLPKDLDAKGKAEVDQFSKLSGPDFDKTYMH